MKQRAEQFRQLHHSRKLLILPNIWELLGALLLQELGYEAVATASASMSFANVVHDGENIPLPELLEQLQKITSAVNIPVSVDFEKGYADSNTQLAENINALIDVGVIGINIEDTDKITHQLLPIEVQSEKIKLIRATAAARDIPFFINARTDVYIHTEGLSEDEKLQETIKRGKAYKQAGADCLYPIVMRNYEHIKTAVEQLQMPINILSLSGIPDLKTLNEIGVARLSLGPSFLKIALQAMKNLAVQLQNYEGLESIIQNTITSDYLNKLIEKAVKTQQ